MDSAHDAKLAGKVASVKLLMTLSDMERFWSHRVQLTKAIVARGWDVCVATEGADTDQALKDMGVRGLSWPHTKNLLSHLTIIFHLHSLIRREQPDILHAITLRQAFYMAMATMLMRRNIPTVMTVAGLGSLFTAPDLKMKAMRPFIIAALRIAFMNRTIQIIFQNEDDRACLLKTGIIQPQDTTLIRGSGVDLNDYAFSPETEAEQSAVVFVSRLLREKGIYEYVEAARQLKAQGVAARFLVAGDYYPKNPHSLDPAVMQGWVKEGVIEWLGQVDDMPALLKRAAIVTLPSYYGEGVPKSLLEAASVGRAIVTTDMPGCREAVVNGTTGILVPPRDARALANALEHLLNNAQKRQSMGRAGRAFMERDFSVESVVSRTLAVYDRLPGMPGGHP